MQSPWAAGRLGAWGVLSSQENKSSTSLMGSWSRLSPRLYSAAAENQNLFSQPHVFISILHNLLSFDLFCFGGGLEVRINKPKGAAMFQARAGFPVLPFSLEAKIPGLWGPSDAQPSRVWGMQGSGLFLEPLKGP